MSTFFEKYKKIRLEQKIDLNDISNRTKINVKYFEAIESGNFDIIQQPYLRLFLRAYINEIGANPDEAISALSEYLLKKGGSKSISKLKVQPSENKKTEKNETKEKTIEPKSSKVKENKFQDISLANKPIKSTKKKTITPKFIIGILLIAAWVVILIVIRNVTLNTDSEENPLQQEEFIETISNYIDFSQLRSDYSEISSQQNAIEITPPYIVKIVTNKTIGIVSQKDTFNIESVPVISGNQHTLNYNDKLDLIINHSNGISAFINGESISDIKAQEYPVRLTFSTSPNSVSIVHYAPAE